MHRKWKISNHPKKIFLTTIIIVAIGVLLWYFRPLPLSNLVSNNSNLLVTEIELGIKDGMAHNNSTDYNDISDKQQNEIQALFDSYSYKRTFSTLFSDGTLRGISNKVVHIFVYEDETFVNTISISDTDEIAVNGKTYEIHDGTELIEEMIEIIHN